MRTVEGPYGVALAIKIGRLRDATTGLFIAAPGLAAAECTITQDDGVGQDQTDNAPAVEADGNVILTISAAEMTAPSAGANERIVSLIASDDEWMPVEIRVLTTDHQSASKQNGVMRQVTPDGGGAFSGATSFPVTDAALPSTALGAGFKGCLIMAVQSDVTTDITPASCAIITGYSKTGSIGTFTYAGGWNHDPTGTASLIRFNLYAGAIGKTEALGTVPLATLADGASVAVDVKKVNSVTLGGAGTAGDPWGPA